MNVCPLDPSCVGERFFFMEFVVNTLFVCSRFTPRPHPLRFLVATIISLPMMVAYLVGRSIGLFRIPKLLRHS